MRSTIIDEAFFSKCSDDRQKQVVVPIVPAVEVKIRRKNADDSPARAVEIDRAANDGWVGIETSPPERIADHQDMRGARFVFIFAEEAADLRLNAQGGKETRRHIAPEHSLGLPNPNDDAAGGKARGKIDKHSLLRSPVQIIGVRHT